ncbi:MULTISPECIES: response regulator [Gammaproteobacteria]|jgi:CheY-like chemotaxis protein|uniref:Response regulator n=1 Tax=Vreelandella halophila TaxID=86177 RepID=A0A9X4YCF1_9GAMM|nr:MULTISPECIES: response regulator [Gammaproteobacteria]KAA8983454.1 response regulator [Halospina sp. K52047b]MYL27139.1 response regulator [Halomonas utahensis]MYL74341.1 response regulator [Halomonas sp. 22501_18_FS]
MSKLKALVVDDASFVRDLVRRTMRSQFPSIELHEAADGRKAQTLMGRERFDLILCDWEMPEISGLELLQWARGHSHYGETPFVMVTSRGDKEHVVEAIREGVSDYLGKPFSPESLGKKVRKVLGSQLGDDGQKASASSDAFRQSADLLTGGGRSQKKETPPPAGESPVESGNAPQPQTGKPAGGARGREATMVDLRFSQATLRGVLRAVTLNDVRVSARRDDAMPQILEQAVVDVDLGDRMARLNGYVYQLQAQEKDPDTKFVQVVVRFVDDDPQKLEDLSHFIARFQG